MFTINEKGEKVQNQSLINPFVYEGEINEEPSMTQPGMTYSVKEILEKHVRGINLPVVKPELYEGASIEAPEIKKAIDVTEVEDMLVTTKARIAAKKSAQNRQPEAADLSTKNPSDDSGTAQIHT